VSFIKLQVQRVAVWWQSLRWAISNVRFETGLAVRLGALPVALFCQCITCRLWCTEMCSDHCKTNLRLNASTFLVQMNSRQRYIFPTELGPTTSRARGARGSLNRDDKVICWESVETSCLFKLRRKKVSNVMQKFLTAVLQEP
jgi:hypothetical protein